MLDVHHQPAPELPVESNSQEQFYDAQAADEETFRTAQFSKNEHEKDESIPSPLAVLAVLSPPPSPPQRRLATVTPPLLIDKEEEPEEEEPEAADYHIFSEKMDEEKRKISVISLNDLSAAFHASSRMRTQSAAPQERKRHGVEKYVSDKTQLNLQFERRRMSQQPLRLPASADVPVPIRQRTSLGFDVTGSIRPPEAGRSGSSSRQHPAASGASSGLPVSSYEISRVRSSPSLVAPSTGRFPFHYNPHTPAGNAPNLRELDARSLHFNSIFIH